MVYPIHPPHRGDYDYYFFEKAVQNPFKKSNQNYDYCHDS